MPSCRMLARPQQPEQEGQQQRPCQQIDGIVFAGQEARTAQVSQQAVELSGAHIALQVAQPLAPGPGLAG